MGFPHGELVVLGTVVLAGIVGKLWLAGRAGETSEEAPSLRRSQRGPAQPAEARGHDEDVEEPVPESGIRLRQGARVRRVDSRKGG